MNQRIPKAESLSERFVAFWRGPRSFTALVPVHVHIKVLRERLTGFDQSLLSGVSDLHSFRLCAIPAHAEIRRGVCLLINSVHDRQLSEHLPELLDRIGPGLLTVLKGAEFSGLPKDLPFHLLQHRIKEDTLYLGAVNRSVREILAERRLKQMVETYVDEQLAIGRWNDATPQSKIRSDIRDHILANAKKTELRTRRPQLGLWAKLLSQIGLVNTFLFFPIIGVLAYDFRSSLHMFPAGLRRWLVRVAGWIWWLYGVIPTVSALLVVRLVEIFESELNVAQADEDKIKRLEATEDASATNEVTLWFSVRPTLMRRVLLRLVLFGAERGSRFFWAQGRLAGIDTIHYARILQLDQGRTMAFLSDYGGGLNRYLDDFMSPESGRAVIPISSNLVDCPKTRWLFQKNDPATFDAQWKSLVRNYQIETSIWYSAYPLMTPREILSNSRLRDGLFAEVLSDSELKKWMRRL